MVVGKEKLIKELGVDDLEAEAFCFLQYREKVPFIRASQDYLHSRSVDRGYIKTFE